MSPRPARKPSAPAGLSFPRFPDLDERYRLYFPRVFAYAYGRTHDIRVAEDLVLKAFRQAFAEAYALPDEAAFETRLFSLARDLLVSYRRDLSTREGAPDDDLLNSPEVARILSHVRRLARREQEVMALKFDAELTNAQIAQIMGLTERKVRTILYRSLQHIQKALQREG